MSKFMSLVRDEKGIQHAEEALLLSLIAVAAATILGGLSTIINGVFTSAGNAM